MQKTNFSRILQFGGISAAALSAVMMTGCGGFSAASNAAAPSVTPAMKGSVHGGQQPVSGATVQLYAANLTGGYASASTALLTVAVTTDANGSFTITSDYTCPTASSLMYLTATGGNPGAGTNANLSLMAALGACGNLTPNTNIVINELTTVASVYALSPFMGSYTAVGTTATNLTGLTNAFASVNKLVNIASGTMPGSALPTGATEPNNELNTLADILASCVNTNGVGGSSTNCASLFGYATPSGGTVPTDTIGAALGIAANPGNNVTQLIGLVPATGAPFQPTEAAATDFTVSIKYAPVGVFNTPSAAAIDATGNVWVTNSGNNTVAILNATTGAATLTSGTPSLNAPSGIAFDTNGNAWVPNKGNSTLSVFTPAGVGSLTSASGLSTPTAIAVDGQNNLWITDSGNSSVAEVTISGTTPQGLTSYSGNGVSTPAGVAINPH